MKTPQRSRASLLAWRMIFSANRFPFRRIVRALALLLATLVTGCGERAGEAFFVRPGVFDYLDCQGIVTARQKAAAREQELKILIDRAGKESLGVLVSEASYRGEYLRAQGEQKMLAEVARRKNCAAETRPAPARHAPASPAPARHVPASPAPARPAPASPAPAIPAPTRHAPASPAPAFPAPDLSAPALPAPDLPAPAVLAPDLRAPAVPAPVLPAPDLRAPDLRAPSPPR